MKKKEEKKQIDKKWKGLKTRIKGFLQSADQEELHQFRVQVKKLKALLTLLQSSNKNHKLLKDFKPVKQIFREAGEVRNAYVNLQLSEQYHLKSADFEQQQQQIMQQGTEAFKANGFKHIKKLKRSHILIKRDVHRLDNKAIKQFYQNNLNEIAACLQNIVFNESLHDCRKKLKLLMYNLKVASKTLPKNFHINHAYINQLQDTIGQWHDNALALELFEPNAANNKTIINKLKRTDQRLRKEIVALAQNFKEKIAAPEPEKPEEKKQAVIKIK